MTTDQFAQVEVLFDRLKGLAPQDRTALLDAECRDSEVRTKVLGMLAHHDEAADLDLLDKTKLPGELERIEDVGQEIGSYKLLEKIGEGAFGDVYMADQREPVRRLVALKILKPGMDSRAVIARFKQERQALAMMDHPNIAKVYDAGTTPTGRPYFVMELVKGEPITTYCNQNQLTIAERLQLFTQVCHAVQHAHQKAVIHRDLKPTNILVSTVDGRPEAKVIDFGIVKALGERLADATQHTGFRQAIGTPAYMSPEQASGSLDIDTRSDVYSLGVVLYELLIGAPPFDVKSLQQAAVEEMFRIIREEEPPKPSTRLSRLTETLPSLAAQRKVEPHRLGKLIRDDLDWIVMRCLEKDRKRRFATASALAEDIGRHLRGEPTESGPQSTVYRMRKFIARRKGPVVAATAVTFSLIGGIALATWQANLASEQRDKAAGERDRAQKAESAQRRLAESESAARHQADERATEANEARAAETKLREDIEYQSYVANVEMAGAAVQFREFNSARNRLAACPVRLRGWEWHWLDAALDNSLAVLQGHSGPINSVNFSPNGQLVVTSSDDNTARIWDAVSGASIAELKGHKAAVTTARFSSDSERIVTGSLDMTARVWNARTGVCIATLSESHGGITTVSFNADGNRIVTGSLDMTATVWDTATWQKRTCYKEHTGSIYAAAFAPTGDRIVTASLDRTARVWNAETGKRELTLDGHSAEVLFADFGPNGDQIITTSADASAIIWDAKSGLVIARLVGHSGAIRKAQFSPDGSHIVTASDDKKAIIWDVTTGAQLITLQGHSAGLRSAGFSFDSLKVVTASMDMTARIWDARSGTEISELTGHRGGVTSAMFSPDNKRVLTSSNDSDARVWSAAQYPEIVSTENKKGASRDAVFSSDGRSLLSLCDDGVVRRWDLDSGKCTAEFPSPPTKCTSFRINADNTRLLTTSEDLVVRLWDAFSANKIADLSQASDSANHAVFSPDGEKLVISSQKGPLRIKSSRTANNIIELGEKDDSFAAAAFSPDGSKIAAVSVNGEVIRLWDLARGKELGTFQGKKGRGKSIEFSADGNRLYVATESFVSVWDLASFRQLFELRGREREFAQTAFSTDGSRIVTVTPESVAQLWNVETKSPPIEMKGHNGWISSVSFNSKGTRIVTGSWDNTARIWDAATGATVAQLTGHSGWVYSATFSHDGTRIVTTSKDRTIRLWDSEPFRDRFAQSKSNVGANPSSGEVLSTALEAVHGDYRDVSRNIKETPELSDQVRDAALELIIVQYMRNRGDPNVDGPINPSTDERSTQLSNSHFDTGRISVSVRERNDLATSLAKALVVTITNSGGNDIEDVVIKLKLPKELKTIDGNDEVGFGTGRLNAGFSREAPVTITAERPGTYEIEVNYTYKNGTQHFQRAVLTFGSLKETGVVRSVRAKHIKVNLGRVITDVHKYTLSYAAELSQEKLENAEFLWMDNGTWMGDSSSGTHEIKEAGLHRITVLVITQQNEEYRGSATIEVSASELIR